MPSEISYYLNGNNKTSYSIDFSNLKDYFLEHYLFLLKEIKERYIILTSGRGAGKSTAISRTLVYKSFIDKGNTLVIQNTYSSIKDASFSEIKNSIKLMGLSDCFEITYSPLSITNKVTLNRFIFRGTDKADRLKSIENIETVWIEEADLINEDSFDIIDLSARGIGKNIKIFMTFNPSSPYVWIKKYIDDPLTYNTKHHISYYYQNKYLDESFLNKMNMLKENDIERYNRDGLGLFGKTEGLIINNEKIKNTNIVDINKIKSFCKCCVGVDFGFTHNQTYVESYYNESSNDLYIYKAIASNGKTNEEFFTHHINNYDINNISTAKVYCDSARPDLIKEIKEKFKLKAVGVNKQEVKVASYIEFINNLNNIYIFESANKFKIECGLWKYVKDTDIPEKINDDLNDALRYSLKDILVARSHNETIVTKQKGFKV